MKLKRKFARFPNEIEFIHSNSSLEKYLVPGEENNIMSNVMQVWRHWTLHASEKYTFLDMIVITGYHDLFLISMNHMNEYKREIFCNELLSVFYAS